ncbi:hypothetical protein [Bacillus salipaludis]|uniref:Uncharacterized protein n=1 Tax=Bacillus salipaludis TaxID=2547811 RepID=A0AA90TWM0_9BACI|nr:hypothetical protein [Bacillus salipaludis]MDQ6600830.1 hypothetical protein [Bacillus salipaludis]
MVKKKPDEVHFMCYGFQTPKHVNVVDEFFQILKETDESYLPKKISICGSDKTLYSVENAKKLWIKSREEMSFYNIDLHHPKYTGSINWGPRNETEISLWIKTDFITKKNGTRKFLELAQKLFLWSNSVFGFTCHISKLCGAPGPGLTYKTCLGDIGWMTLFGLPYVEMFGREVIETVPCKVEEFAENYFMLLTSDEPVRKSPEILEIQEKVKMHLGEDAFDRKDPQIRILTMEDLIAGKNITSREGYRSPDLSEYLTDSEVKCDEGLIAIVNEDGTIITHKINPEK